MDFDKVHAKCFAALPKIAKGDIPPKFAKHAQAHLAECDECREELARLRAGGEAIVVDRKAHPSTLTAVPTGTIPVSAGVPSPPTPLVDKVEPSRWLRWGPVLLGACWCWRLHCWDGSCFSRASPRPPSCVVCYQEAECVMTLKR